MPTTWRKQCTLPSFFVLLTALAGCSSVPSDPQPAPDSGKDAVTDDKIIFKDAIFVVDDVRPDTTRGDADATPLPDATRGDADATRGDADATPQNGDAASCMCMTTQGVGNTSLPCVCEQTTCPDYAMASTMCIGGIQSELRDFSACGLVTIEQRYAFGAATYVFDATTHQLVGMDYATDTNTLKCGGDRLFKLHGGTFPTCAASSTTSLCGDDAGRDAPIDGDGATPDVAPDTGAPDGDASACLCGAPDAGPGAPEAGVTSLPCYCGAFVCPTFNVAATNCPPNFGDSNYNTLVSRTYASCGLVAIERSVGFDRSTYVFDAATHALVGAEYRSDTALPVCSTPQLTSVRAGTFPDPSCIATTEQLCTTVDAGGD